MSSAFTEEWTAYATNTAREMCTLADLALGCWPGSAGRWPPPPWPASLCRRSGLAWPAPPRSSGPAHHGTSVGWTSAGPSRTEERPRTKHIIMTNLSTGRKLQQPMMDNKITIHTGLQGWTIMSTIWEKKKRTVHQCTSTTEHLWNPLWNTLTVAPSSGQKWNEALGGGMAEYSCELTFSECRAQQDCGPRN